MLALLCLFVCLIGNLNGALYFELGPARKDIYRDMINTTASLEEEIKQHNSTKDTWNWAFNNVHDQDLLRTNALKVYYAINLDYATKMREWFNSTDNRFEYYWLTKILMDTIIDVSDQNVTCYRGERPYRPIGSQQLARHGHYQQGDLIYSTQPEFFAEDLATGKQYATLLDSDRKRMAYGDLYAFRATHVFNFSMILPNYVIPPGYRYKVKKVDKADLYESFNVYTVQEAK